MSLITVVLFNCMPIIAIPVVIIGMIIDKKHNVIYGILLALLLAIVAYNFNPQTGHDLYRYYFEMNDYYSIIDFETFFSRNMFRSTKFLFTILEFIIAQIGNNRILPFIITFIGYSITFYMVLDYSKLKNIKSTITIAVLIIFLLTFYHINFISGLAQYLAIVVGFLAFYLEYIKEKKKWFYKILYIIPMLIHISMILIPLIRILLAFKFKKIKLYFIFFLIIYAFLPSTLYGILNLVPGMESIAMKINSYMVNADSIFTNTYDIGTLFFLVFNIYVFYSSRKTLKTNMQKKYIELMEIILLFNLFSIPYRSIFSRILNLTILCMNIYLLTYLQKARNKQLAIILPCIFILCIVLGSVNFNVMKNNDFNNIFSNLFENIGYYFKV